MQLSKDRFHAMEMSMLMSGCQDVRMSGCQEARMVVTEDVTQMGENGMEIREYACADMIVPWQYQAIQPSGQSSNPSIVEQQHHSSRSNKITTVVES